MTVLDSKVFKESNLRIRFCVADKPFANTWQSDYKTGVFYEMPDQLLSAYCSLTRSYSPFEEHIFTQLTKPSEIYQFSSELTLWQYQLTKTPIHYFDDVEKQLPLDISNYSAQQFKADLIETLHFLIGHLNTAAVNQKCIVIAGV